MLLFYYTATLATRALMAFLTHSEVTGRQNVPRSGPLIIVSNHLNNVDPPVLSACVPRRIVFMAKEELYESRGISGLLARCFGAFPVRRGEVDRQALRQALKVLETGLTLGLFPEGTRSPNSQMQSAQPGTAWIPLESGSPILPVAISGTEGIRTVVDILARPTIRICIGRPFRLPEFPTGKRSTHLPEATRIIMESIASLLPPEYRGVYSTEPSR